jgi:hypothetical protein
MHNLWDFMVSQHVNYKENAFIAPQSYGMDQTHSNTDQSSGSTKKAQVILCPLSLNNQA